VDKTDLAAGRPAYEGDFRSVRHGKWKGKTKRLSLVVLSLFLARECNPAAECVIRNEEISSSSPSVSPGWLTM
jgi:hypothetical protein